VRTRNRRPWPRVFHIGNGQRTSDPHSGRLLLHEESPNPSAATTKGDVMVTPIGISEDWDDNNLILFEEF
jgi:hypothetical protein